MTNGKVSLADAARITGATEDELRCAIVDGLLPAERAPAEGGYLLRREDLDRYQRSLSRGPSAHAAGPKKVLIIDDEINFGNLMKLDLARDTRIQARFATWGRDGILVARQFQPNLVLLDFMLPDATADEVLKELQFLKARVGTKVLVYSAHTKTAIETNPGLRQRLISLGADDFMDKSVGLRAMVKRVYDLLGFENDTKVLKARPMGRAG